MSTHDHGQDSGLRLHFEQGLHRLLHFLLTFIVPTKMHQKSCLLKSPAANNNLTLLTNSSTEAISMDQDQDFSCMICFVCFDSLCPINNLSVKQGRVSLG